MIQRGIPFQFRLLTGLIGLASSMIFFGWFRQFTLLFGIHTASVVTVLITGFICLSLGSTISGHLADKVRKPMILLFIFASLLVTYIIIQSVIFDYIKIAFLNTLKKYDPGTFETGILRFSLTFAFLLVPMTLTSGLILPLVRFFIKNLSQSGQFMGAALLSSAGGAAIGIFLSVFLLIPFWGFHALFYAGAIVLIALTGMFLLYFFRKGPKIQNTLIIRAERSKTSLRFKKKRVVLEARAKLTRAMLYGSIFQAFTFSSMFLISIRILIKYNYLKPAYFYSIVLGIMLMGVVIGSALYKGIADKPANKYLTLATLQVLAGFVALFSYALHYVFSGSLYDYLPESRTFVLLFLRETALFSILLFVPAMIYGMSFPLTGRLYPKRLQQIGKAFGHLGSLFFLSLIAGVILTPYILIPLLGIQESYIALCLLILLSGVYLISRDSRLIRGFRIGYALGAIVLFIVVAGILQIMNINFRDRNSGKIIEGRTVSVVSLINAEGTAVYLDGNYYFGTDAAGLKEQIFTAYIPALLGPNIQSAFVAGFGTGITPSILDQYGVSRISIADVFPELIRLSAEVFSRENNDILTGSRVDITIEDSRSYLLRTLQQFDLITAGAEQLTKFPGRYTTEFYRICNERLTQKGILCQIISLKDMSGDNFFSTCKSTSEVFPHLSLWYVSPEKLLLIASKQELKINFCRMSAAFSSANGTSPLDVIHIPDPETILAHLIMMDEQLTGLPTEVRGNTDNRPVIEFGNKMIGKEPGILPLLKGTIDYTHVISLPEGCVADTTGLNGRILRIKQSLLQQASQPSSVKQRHVVDFFEENGSLFQRYL